MISIVIPLYNSADTLAEAVDSAVRHGVLGQEFVFVDDGSTDGTWDMVLDYQRRLPDVVTLKHLRNRGGGAARNTGVAATKNDIVLVLDSDDVLAGGDALQHAVDAFGDPAVDAVATGRSVFFRESTEDVEREIVYRKGRAKFQDLVSHSPSPVTGNLVFRKAAFERAGRYPEHHSFDTQSFGFRLLANNESIVVSEDQLYFQRLPAKPSYYVREARKGNTSRNWFYVFTEHLYKFNSDVRGLIVSYDYADPAAIARGQTVFDVLANMADRGDDLFSPEGLSHNASSAYAAYHDAADETLQMWCAREALRRNDLQACLGHMSRIADERLARRAVFPLLAMASRHGIDEAELSEMRYFFGSTRSRTWRARHFAQRVMNRLGRSK